MIRKNHVLPLALSIGLVVLVGWFLGRALDTEQAANPSRSPKQEEEEAPAPAPRDPPMRSTLSDEERTKVDRQADEGPNPLANGPREDFHPRDPSEWQGMLVDMSQPQVCERSIECGLALACGSDGHCGPCRSDDDCGVGEGCALDHCMPRKNLGCRTRLDCGEAGPDALCMLSGITGGEPRGNSDMRAFCNSGVGGEDPRRQAELNDERARAHAAGHPETPPLTEGQLLQAVRAGKPPAK